MLSTGEIRIEFRARLRSLCAMHKSVSYICERTGINRQQFEKYLSGTSVPSLTNAVKIAMFFKMSLDELMLGQRYVRSGLNKNAETSPYAKKLLAGIKSVEDVSVNLRFPKSGYYLSINNWFGRKNPDIPHILICLLRLSRENNVIYYDRRQCLQKTHDEERRLTKYYGTGHVNMESLYLRYADVSNKDSFGAVILKRVTYMGNDLLGIQTRTASTLTLEPTASRVYCRFLGEKPNLRDATKQCGAYPAQELSKYSKIINWLTEPLPANEFLIKAKLPP